MAHYVMQINNLTKYYDKRKIFEDVSLSYGRRTGLMGRLFPGSAPYAVKYLTFTVGRGETVALTNKEYWVLETFLRKKNQIISRAQLEEALYGWGEEIGSNAVEVYIHYLRKKLGANVIQTVRGVGYQLGPMEA